jgi:hypothetical protein
MLKLLEISPVLGQGWVNILARSDSFLALACFIRVSVLCITWGVVALVAFPWQIAV